MEVKKIEATLQERISKKGTAYQCVVLKLTENMEKLVFLTPAEIELLKIKNSVPSFK